MSIMKSREFCSKLGISLKTLERLEKNNEINPIRKHNRRYYTEEMVNNYLGLKINKKKDRKIIGYYRVSTNGQKKRNALPKRSIRKIFY